AYGASLFDAKDGKVKMFASGGGTGNTVLLANYENAYWVVHAFSSADCYAYSMFKYNGADSIDEKLCFGYEIDESGKEIYYKEIDSGEEIDITQEEYKSLIDTIIPFK
nr:hypothetical protein [Pseudobutyrivibrio sp.]